MITLELDVTRHVSTDDGGSQCGELLSFVFDECRFRFAPDELNESMPSSFLLELRC